MSNFSVILAGITVATLAPLLAQQEAFRGSLSEYLALDEDGVTVGDATFSQFKLLPLQQGTSSLSAQFVDVVPLTKTDGGPGFKFEIMDGATVDDFFELRFAFEASGPGFTGIKMVLNNVNVRASSNASADVVFDLAVAGEEPASLNSLIAIAAPGGFGMLEDEATFSEESALSLQLDAILDGGGEGVPGVVVASVGSVSVTFTEAPPAPEPQPIVIKDSGLADEDTFFIEFTATPSSPYLVVSSTTLADDFPTDAGSSTTDASGFARVEIDLTDFPPSAFFSIKSSS